MKQKVTWAWALGMAFLVSGCGGGPAAMDVCRKLEAASVASGCKEGKPTGVYSAAKQVAEFEVVGLAGQKAVVLAFDQTGTYDNTVRSYSELGSRNADHRTGNRKRLIFTSLPEQAPPELAEKTDKVVADL